MFLYTVTLRCNNNGCLDWDDGELILSEIFTSEKSVEEFTADCEEIRAEWDARVAGLVFGVEPPESDEEYFNLFDSRGYVRVAVASARHEDLT